MGRVKSETHKEHHFVPEFYLRAWASPDESQSARLTCFKWILGQLKSDRISPKGAASERFLYSRHSAAPDQRQSVEREFFGARIDDPAAPAIAKMIRGGETLSDAEATAFARYLLAQRYRTPGYIKHLRSEAALAVKDLIADIEPEYQRLSNGDLPDKLSDFMQRTMPALPDYLGIQSLPRLIEQPSLANILVGMEWGWGKLDVPGRTLLTGDRPVIYTRGLGDPACIVALPLSPTVAFFAMKDPERLRRLLAHPPRELIGRLNLHIASQARAYVYARDELQRRFLEKYFKRPEEQPPETFRRLRPNVS